MGKRAAACWVILGAISGCLTQQPARAKPDVPSPSPSVSDPASKLGCRGTINDALLEELHARAHTTRNCYEVTVESNPRLGGRMNIQFDVNPSGSVKRATLSLDELGNQELSSCVLAIFEKPYQSPPERECVTIVVPINFTPKP